MNDSDDNHDDSRPVKWRNPDNADLYLANCAKVPELAYVPHPSDDCRAVVVKRGHGGYWPVGTGRFPDKETALGYIREQNTRLQVTSAEANAMLNGSVFGFDTPSADPANDINTEKAPKLSDFVKE